MWSLRAVRRLSPYNLVASVYQNHAPQMTLRTVMRALCTFQRLESEAMLIGVLAGLHSIATSSCPVRIGSGRSGAGVFLLRVSGAVWRHPERPGTDDSQ